MSTVDPIPDCPYRWCHGDAHHEGRHSGRTWHYDAGELAFDLAAVTFHHDTSQPSPVLRIRDTAVVAEVMNNMTLDEIDALIDMLRAARGDLAFTMEMASREVPAR